MEPRAWWEFTFGLWWFFPLLCLLFIVVMAVMLGHCLAGTCTSLRRGHVQLPGGPWGSASQRLDRRYAEGNIRRQEYLERKRSHSPPSTPGGQS